MTPATVELFVDGHGRVRCLYTEALNLAQLGTITIRRASHVEPATEPGGGGWSADLSPVGGPVLGPFARRSDALAAEAAWIVAHVLNPES